MDELKTIHNMRLVMFVNHDLMMDCSIEQDHFVENSQVTLVIPTIFSFSEVRRVLLHIFNAIQAADNADGLTTEVQQADYPNSEDWLDYPF